MLFFYFIKEGKRRGDGNTAEDLDNAQQRQMEDSTKKELSVSMT